MGKLSFIKKTFLIVILCVIVGVCAGAGGYALKERSEFDNVATVVTNKNSGYFFNIDNKTEYASAFKSVANNIIGSCVMVKAGDGELMSMGAGTIITADGYILTNYNLVFNVKANNFYNKINVTLLEEYYDSISNKTQCREVVYEAKYVPRSAGESSEVAILKIESDFPFPTVKFDKSVMDLGEVGLIVGSTSNIRFVVSNVMVANPYLGNSSNLLKLDGTIYGGHSGSGLFNLSGNVVGMLAYRTLTAGSDSLYNITFDASNALDCNKLLVELKQYNPIVFEGVTVVE